MSEMKYFFLELRKNLGYPRKLLWNFCNDYCVDIMSDDCKKKNPQGNRCKYRDIYIKVQDLVNTCNNELKQNRFSNVGKC